MTRRSWILLLALAGLWGASYLFIEIGLEDLSPAMVVFLRTALAGAILLPLALRRGALSGLGSHLPALVFLAAVQVAGPFLLISVGQEEISSSLAGILVASAPIFTALLAIWIDRAERPTLTAVAGIVIGIVGVSLLLGLDVGGDGAALVGALLVVLASLGYAVGAFALKRTLSDRQPLGVVTMTMLLSAALAAPVAALSFPAAAPGLDAVGAMLALGVGGTGIAFVIFYGLIADVGPARASVVAYISPVFAVLYGVTLLGESFTAGTLAGLVLILAGSWMAGGGYKASPSKSDLQAPRLRASAAAAAAGEPA